MDDKKAEILAELSEYRKTLRKSTAILPTDLTYKDIREAYGISENTARSMMQRLVAEGYFEKLRIPFDDGIIVVFRRTDKPMEINNPLV